MILTHLLTAWRLLAIPLLLSGLSALMVFLLAIGLAQAGGSLPSGVENAGVRTQFMINTAVIGGVVGLIIGLVIQTLSERLTVRHPYRPLGLPVYLAGAVGLPAVMVPLLSVPGEATIFIGSLAVHTHLLVGVMLIVALGPISLGTVARLCGAGITPERDGLTVTSISAALTGRRGLYIPYEAITEMHVIRHRIFTDFPYETMRLHTAAQRIEIDRRYDRLEALLKALFRPLQAVLHERYRRAFVDTGRVEMGSITFTREGVSQGGNFLEWQAIASYASSEDSVPLYRSARTPAMILTRRGVPNALLIETLIHDLRQVMLAG